MIFKKINIINIKKQKPNLKIGQNVYYLGVPCKILKIKGKRVEIKMWGDTFECYIKHLTVNEGV